MQSTIHGITPQALADLHDLVQINLDSAEGYETTAKLVHSPHYADLFHTIGRQRNNFAAELNRLIVSYGDRPEDSGSLLGKAHKWWIDLRVRLNDGDDKVVMIEAERAEDRILALYEKALSHGLPEPIIETIDRQLLLVRQDHDHIRALRDALKNTG